MSTTIGGVPEALAAYARAAHDSAIRLEQVARQVDAVGERLAARCIEYPVPDLARLAGRLTAAAQHKGDLGELAARTAAGLRLADACCAVGALLPAMHSLKRGAPAPGLESSREEALRSYALWLIAVLLVAAAGVKPIGSGAQPPEGPPAMPRQRPAPPPPPRRPARFGQELSHGPEVSQAEDLRSYALWLIAVLLVAAAGVKQTGSGAQPPGSPSNMPESRPAPSPPPCQPRFGRRPRGRSVPRRQPNATP